MFDTDDWNLENRDLTRAMVLDKLRTIVAGFEGLSLDDNQGEVDFVENDEPLLLRYGASFLEVGFTPSVDGLEAWLTIDAEAESNAENVDLLREVVGTLSLKLDGRFEPCPKWAGCEWEVPALGVSRADILQTLTDVVADFQGVTVDDHAHTEERILLHFGGARLEIDFADLGDGPKLIVDANSESNFQRRDLLRSLVGRMSKELGGAEEPSDEWDW